MGYNGVETAQRIHTVFRNNGLKTEVLAASFKNSQQILELCEFGIGAATAAPAVIEALVNNAAITGAVDAFTADFEKLVGIGKTMSNC